MRRPYQNPPAIMTMTRTFNSSAAAKYGFIGVFPSVWLGLIPRAVQVS